MFRLRLIILYNERSQFLSMNLRQKNDAKETLIQDYFRQLGLIFISIIIIMSKSKRTASVGLMVSPSKAIFIDTQENHQSRYNNFFESIGKLPSFEPDDKITKVLYSKFLVKGVTPINSKMMMEKVKGSKPKKYQSVTKERNNVPFDIKTIVTEQGNNQNNIQQIKESLQQSGRGIFQFSIANRDSQKKVSRPQTAFQRSLSLGQFNRPQSASHKVNKQTPRPNSVQRSTKKRNRTQTAITRAQSLKNHNRFEYNDQTQPKHNLFTIQDNKSLNFGVNYIEKNKRQASLKKLGTYITSIQNPKETIEVQKSKKNQKNQINDEQRKYTVRRLTVSDKQKRQIKQKHRRYLNYMKNNMPYQYSQYINFISGQGMQSPLQRSLLSISLDYEQKFQPSKSQIYQTEIRNFYRDLYNACVDAEYGIKKTMKKQNKIDKISAILNIYDCQKIIKLFEQIKKMRENSIDPVQKINELKLIVSGLDFFQNLRSQTFNSLFQMNFQVINVQEDQIILQQNSSIQKIFIILNGSVSKKQKEQQQFDKDINRHKAPQFYSTLFDGQIFGEPTLPLQKTLTYSIRSQQQCLFFTVPFKQYKKALSNNQNIEDRIELLRFIFQANGQVIQLSREDLQILAFQMESKVYSAQQIIFREGEQCSDLIIVANGKTSVVYETFKQTQKVNNQITIKRKQPKFQMKIIQFKRKNVRKYEHVHQTAEQITYYYYEQIQQKIRGHTLNWQGFCQKLQQDGKVSQSTLNLHYSLMSIHDNTRVYILPPQKIESLPNHIQKSLRLKAQQMKSKLLIKPKSIQQSKKWEKYKNNLVKSILKPHLPNNLMKFHQNSNKPSNRQDYIWINEKQ